MSTKKKLLEAAAGNAGGATYVDDVFSTYLYTGTNATQAVVNGLDLAGEGGLVWTKARTSDPNELDHQLMDSEQGAFRYVLESNTTNARFDYGGSIVTPNSDGFTLSSASRVNQDGYTYVGWSFRKQPGFFDVVTYTGDGTSNRNISHNLGSTPGCILIKNLSLTTAWVVYHRSLGGPQYYLELNTTGSRQTDGDQFSSTAPTDSVFTVGPNSGVNRSGDSYVAYLFAHDAQDFGTDSDEAIIKCGSYTGNGSTDGPEIDLGFEPQWVMTKRANGTGGWYIADNMRGFVVGGNDARLYPASSADESNTFNYIDPTATGFKVTTDVSGYNGSGDEVIYIAIRRGPMKTPESGTEVFNVYQGNATGPPGVQTPFPVDWGFYKNVTNSSAGWEVGTRLLQGKELAFNSTAAEVDDSKFQFDYQDGWRTGSLSSIYYAWNFRRAPGFFDVVAYTGDGQSGGYRFLNHNLGVVPEMIWLKNRTNSGDWFVASTYVDLGGTSYLRLNDHEQGPGGHPISFTFTNSNTFSIIKNNQANVSNNNYIAYLFATVPGISKVGSYTGNSSATQDIDCGFSSGARFVLIKRTDSTGNWNVYDTERGIVAGDDPRIELNTSDAQYTISDWVDPLSSGFTVVTFGGGDDDPNINGAEYIFLAIA